MRNLIILLILLLTGCQKQLDEELVIGTWNRCLNDGGYAEFKIMPEQTIFLTSESDHVTLIENKIENNSIINIKGINASLLFEPDTLYISFLSKNKLILESNENYTLELDKTENNIKKIDSVNLENWKKETISKFKKRAKNRNCPDLRTEDEKIITDLDSIIFSKEEETEIPVEQNK